MDTKRILIEFGVPHFRHSRECIRGIYEYALRHCPEWRFANDPFDFYRSFEPGSADLKGSDGLFLWVHAATPLAEAAKAAGIPAINLTLPDSPLPFPVVTSDNEAIGRAAGAYFANPLVKRSLYFGPDNRRSRLRHAGYAAALKAAGRLAPAALFDSSHHRGKAMQRRLQKSLEVLAGETDGRIGVFAFSDSFAYAVSEIAQRMGLKVPQQVAIVGCDDDDLICSLGHPPLSSIPIGSRETGTLAAQHLQSLLRGDKVPELTLVAPHPLVERMSSSPLAVDDPMLVRAFTIIQSFVHTGLNVNELVQNMGISRRNLENRFRRELGRTPLEEIQRLRVEKAVHLLGEGGCTNAEIAHLCGFGSSLHFEQTLRKQTGHPPSFYRPPAGAKPK